MQVSVDVVVSLVAACVRVQSRMTQVVIIVLALALSRSHALVVVLLAGTKVSRTQRIWHRVGLSHLAERRFALGTLLGW